MVAVLGEVLWDVFDHSRRLGGAPLNFAAHACRLGYDPLLISAVGADSLGEEALGAIEALGLRSEFLQKTARFPTGSACVHLGPRDQTQFMIKRPAAYDAIRISDWDLEQLASHAPGWLYHGTLFASTAEGEAALCRLANGLPAAARFYDLNLRPECWNAPLVTRLLRNADAVKLNEEEFERVQDFTGLPSAAEAFCREGAARYGWQAACVTFASRGCAIFVQGDYVEARGHCVDVADPVGAGDMAGRCDRGVRQSRGSAGRQPRRGDSSVDARRGSCIVIAPSNAPADHPAQAVPPLGVDEIGHPR